MIGEVIRLPIKANKQTTITSTIMKAGVKRNRMIKRARRTGTEMIDTVGGNDRGERFYIICPTPFKKPPTFDKDQRLDA